ncbi:MAG: protein kinase [Kofleriaceae bacterium]|nr:protein kinase [Kofleriaceae bacterium]
MSVDAAIEEHFGPYLVYERLGVGGMATVHRALEQGAEGFERMVALKRLLPHLAEDASFIKSFVREAKLASILNHVNIVQIYELGRVGTEYFISMEYIDGRDIRRILRHARKVTGPPPIHVTVGLMLQLCEALDYAHNKVDDQGHPLGLVHRDISPSNLIVTSGGHLKIIDFGIAKAQSSQLRTQTGRVKGKLAYMAPEAISGSKELDARSDLWAAGVILHELLTARPLFASKNEYQTLLKVQKGDLHPPSTFNQGCPPELDAIVFRALARNPDERFANASELRDELLELKKQYSLATGYRDVAQWIEWAFNLELPAGFTGNTVDPSIVLSVETPRPQHNKTPRPHRNTEEDEAVEVVWGAGAEESDGGGPVVLEDVPDVSEKHRQKRDADGFAADVLTPLPTQGTMPSIYGDSGGLAARTRSSDPSLPPPAVESALADSPKARGSEQIQAQHARQSGSQPIAVPSRTPASTSGPVPRSARPTSPNLDAPNMNDRLAAQRDRDTQPPQNLRRSPSQPPPNVSRDSARMRVATIPPLDKPLPKRAPTLPPVTRTTDSFAKPLTAEDLFGDDPALARAAAALDDSSPRHEVGRDTDTKIARSSAVTPPVAVPVVRFSKTQSIPPLNATTTPVEPAVDQSRPIPQTKPGIAPVAGAQAATYEVRPRSASNVQIGASIAARAKPKRTGLVVLGGLLLAGGAAAGVFVFTQNRNKDNAAATATRVTPERTTGTIKFVLEPADAEIMIAGQVVHTGSPFSSELPAGVHQIEIHRNGYKSWLTSFELSAAENASLRVVLEPLTTNVDASLTITTTPAGLEVVIDGQPFAQKTPVKTQLKVGSHTIAVRQDGVELWHQTLDAEPSSDYEINRSFTAEKQRERASYPKTPARPRVEKHSSDAKQTEEAPPPPTTPSTSPLPAAAPTAAPNVVTTTPPPTAAKPTPVAPATAAPAITTTPPAPSAAKPGTPTPTLTPTPTQKITAKPVVPAAPKGPPPIVPPNAVTRIAGDVPSVEKFKNVQLPSALAAKLCIDATGKVDSVAMVSKLDRRVAEDLQEALRGWRYAPYKKNGAASPACFVVTFKAR